MKIDVKKLVDAVADGINNTVTLPEHRTLKYVEPRGLTEEMAPALVVHPASLTYQTTLTSEPEVHGVSLVVAWHERAAYGAGTNGVGDQELAEAALGRAEAIGELLGSWTSGVTGYETAIMDVGAAQLGLEDGLLWTARWSIEVSRL